MSLIDTLERTVNTIKIGKLEVNKCTEELNDIYEKCLKISREHSHTYIKKF